jgi:hypothetical protein
VYDLKDKMIVENNDLMIQKNNQKLRQVAQYIANKEVENEKFVGEMPRRHHESSEANLGLMSPKRSRLPGLP